MKIDYKVVNPLVGDVFPIPQYATTGSAAMDLRACITADKQIRPGEKILVPTGIALDINNPEIACQLTIRSSLGHKHGLALGNQVGLIDSDYQGELFISLINNGVDTYLMERGERIAQMAFYPVIQIELNKVDEFSVETERGTGGFGHTGKQEIVSNNSVSVTPVPDKPKNSPKEFELNDIIDQLTKGLGESEKSVDERFNKIEANYEALHKEVKALKKKNEVLEKSIKDESKARVQAAVNSENALKKFNDHIQKISESVIVEPKTSKPATKTPTKKVTKPTKKEL